MKVKISPSILSADFSRLGKQIAEAEKSGADYIHVDVMDGHFVPNITIGAPVVESIRPVTKIPLDVHLMIEEPINRIPDFAKAGADIIVVHAEACTHLHRTVQLIKELGKRAGVALNPATSLTALDEILPYLDLVLIMSVNPGYSNQPYITESTDKIARLRQILKERNSKAELEVDGGINPKTAAKVVDAGADVLVAGSAIFNSKDTVDGNMKRLRDSFS